MDLWISKGIRPPPVNAPFKGWPYRILSTRYLWTFVMSGWLKKTDRMCLTRIFVTLRQYFTILNIFLKATLLEFVENCCFYVFFQQILFLVGAILFLVCFGLSLKIMDILVAMSLVLAQNGCFSKYNLVNTFVYKNNLMFSSYL